MKIVEIYKKMEINNNKQPSHHKLSIEAEIPVGMACKVIIQVKFNNIIDEKEEIRVEKLVWVDTPSQ